MNMKTVKFLFAAIVMATVMFHAYGQSSASNPGVIINGVKWATCNVDTPGAFAAKSEDAGKFYQWNIKKGWQTTGKIPNWGGEINTKVDDWEKANDPSPSGWRMPTLDEMETLFDANKVNNVWTTQNGVKGRKFTDKTTGNSIFLPAVGFCKLISWGSEEGVGECQRAGELGYYWSGSSHWSIHGAFHMRFGSITSPECTNSARNLGFSVRPVAD